MSFIHVKTIDNKDLWLNLDQVGAISFSPEDHFCLIEISGGEPHQVSMDEFTKIEPLLKARQEKPKPKKKNIPFLK